MWWKIVLIVLLSIILAFLVYLIVNAIKYKPIPMETTEKADVEFDEEKAIKDLQELVKCKTVSYYDSRLEDDKEFNKLVRKLPKMFPHVFEKCTLKKFDGRALLFYWKGRKKGEASVFMAHYDVVPVDENGWDKPAFDAIIEDEIMWGRGTLDTKVTFSGILNAADNLIKQGFKPEHDIYLAFSGCEEINGPGAKNIVEYFKKNNIKLSMVLDEGGAVVSGVFPGVKERCGLVGIAEKGMANVTFSSQSNGGHASAPKPHTPVGVLSKACVDVENHPFTAHYTKAVEQMFDILGRRSTFIYKILFANFNLFKGIFDSYCKKSGGEINALIRTTCAFTQMNGSKAPNVVPSNASMTANLRLNPEDTLASISAYLTKVVNNKDVKISVDGQDPSPISKTDCAGYKRVEKAVADTWDCVVAPYLMVQCSDSRHYGEISDRVYRFSAYEIDDKERKSIHGDNEHIHLTEILHAVEFFIRVMKQC